MQETEVKILQVNRNKIEEQLIELGAKKAFDGDIRTIFFDFKSGDIVKAKNVLRLRKEETKTELTFKKVNYTKAAKHAEELTVEISSLETMQKILENIGLRGSEDMLKHRVSFKLDGARFDIDRYLGEYSFIPEFLEIEGKNVDSIRDYASKLGFKPEDCLSWSTYDLIQHYSSKKGQEQKQCFK